MDKAGHNRPDVPGVSHPHGLMDGEVGRYPAWHTRGKLPARDEATDQYEIRGSAYAGRDSTTLPGYRPLSSFSWLLIGRKSCGTKDLLDFSLMFLRAFKPPVYTLVISLRDLTSFLSKTHIDLEESLDL